MSFQPVLSACVLSGVCSLYIDTDRVLRAAGGDVPAGLAGLSDCVEVRSSNGVDFAAPRAVYGGVLNVVHDLEVCLGLEPLFQFEPSLVQLFLPTLQVAHFTLGVGKVSQGFRSAAVPS